MTVLFVLATVALPAVSTRPGLCRPDFVPAATTIRGRDCVVLKDFFARFEQGRTNKVPDEGTKRVLLQALPVAYKEGWVEAMSRLEPGESGRLAMTVRVLHVAGRKDEKSIRALITYTLLSKAGSAPGARYDERLAGLVIRRDDALLSLMEQEKEPGGDRLVHILQEKEVRIGGRGVIGLNFTSLRDGPDDADAETFLKEERINFYLFQDNGIEFAGSVLKAREERLREGPKGAKSVYKGAVVFKKDMKGNIVGILSPYTVTNEGKRVGKGMVRYAWDADKGTFVKEQE